MAYPGLGLVLMWLSHSQQPLLINELWKTLGVEIESRDLDPDNALLVDTVLNSHLGLVTSD